MADATAAVADADAAAGAGADPRRWRVMWIFGLQGFLNQVLWITFAPISAEVGEVFGVSPAKVNLLSLVYMFLFPVGMVLWDKVERRLDLRGATLAAAWLNAAGAAIRALASLSITRKYLGGKSGSFVVLFVGQSIAALAQPFFINAPARIAMEWFPHSERDMATIIIATLNPIGSAVGQLAPSVAVSSDGGKVQGITPLLIGEFFCCAVATLSVQQGFLAAPCVSPSRAALVRRSTLNENVDALLGADSPRRAWGPYALLLRDRSFCVLAVAMGMGIGLINSLLTVLAQLLRPAGYSASDAGLVGALLLVAGLPSTAATAVALDRTHAYRPALKGGILAAGAALLLFSAALRPGNLLGVSLAAAALGAACLPLLPVTLESAAETTYPVPEQISGGVILLLSQVFGVLETYAYGWLLPDDAEFETVWNPAAFLGLAIVAFIAVALGLFWNPKYKRHAVEVGRESFCLNDQA